MTQAGRRLIAAAKQAVSLASLHRQRTVLKEWDMGQARTCLVCGEVFLTKKNLRIHRAKHRNKLAFMASGNRTEMLCEKTVTT